MRLRKGWADCRRDDASRLLPASLSAQQVIHMDGDAQRIRVEM